MSMRRLLVLSMIGLTGLANTASAGPLDIPDLRLWLDAGQNVTKDGSDIVSSWGDVTGVTNNTVAQNVGKVVVSQRPLWVASAIGGQPAIRFDGLNDGLENTVDNLLGSGTDRTIFVVGTASAEDVQEDGLGGTMVSIRRSSFFGTVPFFAAQIYDNIFWDGFDEACCGTANPTAVYTDGVAINHVFSANDFPTSNFTQPFISEHRVDSLLLSFGVNGADVPIQRLFNNAEPIVAAETSTDTGFIIGERADKGDQHWEGDIAEVLIYERSLSFGETQEINSYLSQKYGISVVIPASPDYNDNGVVDAADYVVWRDTLEQVGAGLPADGNNNGMIDQGDYGVWRANFGAMAGVGAGLSHSAIPEPASWILFGSAAACGLALRHGRRKPAPPQIQVPNPNPSRFSAGFDQILKKSQRYSGA